jgi:uncharacterized membrane protein YfcA
MQITILFLLLTLSTNLYAYGDPSVILAPVLALILFVSGVVKTIRYKGGRSLKRKSLFILSSGFLIFISLGFVRKTTLDSDIVLILMIGVSALSFIISRQILRLEK